MPKKNSYVCINHFEEHNFNRSKRRLRLRAGSKPTLFNNASEAKQVFTEKKNYITRAIVFITSFDFRLLQS